MSFEFDFTAEKLNSIIPKAKFGVDVWFNELYELLPTFEITSVVRVAAFLAQTAHESGGYSLLKENLNYGAQGLANTWPNRFAVKDVDCRPIKPYKPSQLAGQIQRQPELIANYVYANRMGNGSPESGDGWHFSGRGLIQLTGRTNYSLFADYAGIDVEEAPEYIETPRGAVHSACWFWYANKLNLFADSGDFEQMTKRINGGVIGLADRIEHYNHALEILV